MPEVAKTEGRIRIRGAQCFRSGKHRGRPYSDKDLDEIIRNFEKHSNPAKGKPTMRVPLVVGHEEENDADPDDPTAVRNLNDTRIPAEGWVSKVYRKGHDLFFDADDVTPRMAKWIEDGTYRNISPEIYDEPPEGVDGEGKMFRRVSALGGEQPQVKGMRELQEALVERYGEAEGRKLAERWPTALRGHAKQNKSEGRWTCFAEEPMSSDELLKMVGQRGGDMAILDKCDPAVLAEILRLTEPEEVDEPEGDEPVATETMTPEQEEEERKKNPPVEEMSEPEAPEEDDDAEKMAEYGAACKKYAAWKKSRKMAEVSTETDMPEKPMPEEPMRPTKVVTHYSEKTPVTVGILRQLLPDLIKGVVGKQIARLEKHSERIESDQKRREVEGFIRLHSFNEGDPKTKQVRILPIDLDAGDPLNIRNQLMAADNATVVHKFSEGKREVSLTAFDVLRKNIERRKPQVFGESQVKRSLPGAVNGTGSPKAGTASGEDHEVEKVRGAFEAYSEKFPRGMTADKLVAGFKANREAVPETTAEDFLGDLVA